MKNTTREVKTLIVGEGEIRVGIGLGYSAQVADGMWLKPSIYVEVPAPKGVEIAEFTVQVLEFAEVQLIEVYDKLYQLLGLEDRLDA